MTPQHIEFVDMRASVQRYVPTRWWDALRWWAVRKLGGDNPLDTVKVTRVPINPKNFMERLYRQRTALFDSFGREPKVLWIGADEYVELMNSPQFNQAFQFTAQYNLGRYEVMGLTVKVVPWIRGAVVMPENTP